MFCSTDRRLSRIVTKGTCDTEGEGESRERCEDHWLVQSHSVKILLCSMLVLLRHALLSGRWNLVTNVCIGLKWIFDHCYMLSYLLMVANLDNRVKQGIDVLLPLKQYSVLTISNLGENILGQSFSKVIRSRQTFCFKYLASYCLS